MVSQKVGERSAPAPPPQQTTASVPYYLASTCPSPLTPPGPYPPPCPSRKHSQDWKTALRQHNAQPTGKRRGVRALLRLRHVESHPNTQNGAAASSALQRTAATLHGLRLRPSLPPHPAQQRRTECRHTAGESRPTACALRKRTVNDRAPTFGMTRTLLLSVNGQQLLFDSRRAVGRALPTSHRASGAVGCLPAMADQPPTAGG